MSHKDIFNGVFISIYDQAVQQKYKHHKVKITCGSCLRREFYLVDDEPDIALALKLGLESNGFIVKTYNDPTTKSLDVFVIVERDDNQNMSVRLGDFADPFA